MKISECSDCFCPITQNIFFKQDAVRILEIFDHYHEKLFFYHVTIHHDGRKRILMVLGVPKYAYDGHSGVLSPVTTSYNIL